MRLILLPLALATLALAACARRSTVLPGDDAATTFVVSCATDLAEPRGLVPVSGSGGLGPRLRLSTRDGETAVARDMLFVEVRRSEDGASVWPVVSALTVTRSSISSNAPWEPRQTSPLAGDLKERIEQECRITK
jgi:hypothetical protein